MATTFFYLILAFIIFNYVFDRILEYLNSTRLTNILPPALAGIYDAEKYKKSQDYERTKNKLSTVQSTFSFGILMIVLLTGSFAWLDLMIRDFTANPYLLALVFFAVITMVSGILSLPFELYHTFVIEEKFGFNLTTVKTFILDKIKGILLGAILGGALLLLIILIYEKTGNFFWLIAWAVVSFFSVFMSMFYSDLIVPLFNKQKPLEPGELRDAIERFANKVGFKLKNIYVIDGSKRSRKSNAYFTGLGAKKRIVLYDTLIQDHTTEELVAVLAHEIGHYKKKHTLVGLVLSLVQTGVVFFILSLFIRKNSLLAQQLCQSLGGFSYFEGKASFHLGIVAFGLLYEPISLVLGILMNMLSRKNEYAADRYAGMNYDAVKLQDALKKLSVNNLSNLLPHPVYVFVHYSHPPLLDRLKALDSADRPV